MSPVTCLPSRSFAAKEGSEGWSPVTPITRRISRDDFYFKRF
ncbi:MAG: hypothetical protein ABSH15_16215 [Verrucomicrobiota bacterium]